jgi:L-seryl-tRNA(Ser) seleniumtransferase
VQSQLRLALQYSLRAVINATGVILHTNLGRAPLGEAAIEHIRETAESYSNLEFDLSAGERGKRDAHVDRLFQRLLSEARAGISTIVVNNNAAAVLLALNTFAERGFCFVCIDPISRLRDLLSSLRQRNWSTWRLGAAFP